MDSGHYYTSDSCGPVPELQAVITSCCTPPDDITFTDYEDFSEALHLMGLSKKGWAHEAGYQLSTVYSWRQHGLPRPVVSYLAMQLAYMDKLNPDRAVKIA